jgi:nucleotide-binding universal stress UspA family protein
MSIRKILVPLVARYDAEALKQVSEASLRAGLQLGQVFGAHVAVCCFSAAWHNPKDNLVFGIPGAAIEQLLKEIDKRNEQCFWYARSLFDRLAEEFEPHRSEDPDPTSGFTVSFREISEEIAKAAAEEARLADISVLAALPEPDHDLHRRLLEALVSDSGRPLLMVPTDHKELRLSHLVIAWNDTAESARALAAANTFMATAEDVSVLSIREKEATTAGKSWLESYLGWHREGARLVEAELGGRKLAEALREETAALDADLLVMGAETRGRLRQLVFGGVTGAMLSQPGLPTLVID